MLVSIIIPTYKGASFIPYLLESLGKQRFKDYEVITVIKPSGDGTEQLVGELCNKLDLTCKILIQRDGYFTHALNMGIKNSKGELILFTDDDAILPEDWIERHMNAHTRFKNGGAVSGGAIPYPITAPSSKASFMIKEQTISRLRRGWQFVKPVFNKPHPLFKKYRLGIYITRDFRVAIGFAIHFKLCLSLPVAGVNMSFKKDAIEDSLFPEYPLFKTAPGNEQYFAAQLVLRGWESLYDPHIQVRHIIRTGISKLTRNDERELMRRVLAKLLQEYE